MWLWPRIWLRRLLFATPLRRFLFPRYQFAFSPRQLATLIDLVDEAVRQPGDIVEIGCFVGATTVYVNKHLAVKNQTRPYIAIDTFQGFAADDVANEEKDRGKQITDIERQCLFAMNKKSWFDYTMRLNGLDNVLSIAGDVKRLTLSSQTKAVCFVLLDVDLYQPTKAALNKIWELLVPGGIIVIDDCAADHVFDGSRQAWLEFIQLHGLSETLLHEKLAVIRKPL